LDRATETGERRVILKWLNEKYSLYRPFLGGVSMAHRLHKLGQYVRGWTAYCGISQYYRPVPELDDWIRRRMRMCYWKQWRWVRTKIKHLLDLGVRLKTAIRKRLAAAP